ncbi:acyltransferase family protein [Neotabrizicola sp. sgz301269]|uniref:acyltransferase family protein n=1 Tax=Neotabrizicola sp. sgz301269 TaxID=3276282 RepID=UPI00376F4D93
MSDPVDVGHGTHQPIPSLDGIRALAVTIVLFGHARVSQLIPGGFGVTIFFFLSGLLITTLFLREAGRYGAVSLKAFYIRRLLRLSPPLFVTMALVYLAVALGLHPGKLDPAPILSQIFYVYNYYAAWSADPIEGAHGFNVLWSLAVEEHFYLIFPLLFLLWLKNVVRTGHILIILAGFCAWRLVQWHVFAVEANDIYMRSDTRFDSILWGCFLALLQGNGRADRLFPDRPLPRAMILLAATVVILFCFILRDPAFRETWRYTLQGIALMPFFHYAVRRPDLLLFRPLNWHPVALVGSLSYSLYLIHYVLLIWLETHGLLPSLPLAAALLVGALALIYAAALSRFVEAPVRKLRNRITGH